MTTTTRNLVAAGSAAMLILAAAPAFAQTTSVAVRYSDLALNTAAGRNTLDSRIDSATRQVCGTADGYNLREIINTRKCRIEAIKAARADVARARTGSDVALVR